MLLLLLQEEPGSAWWSSVSLCHQVESWKKSGPTDTSPAVGAGPQHHSRIARVRWATDALTVMPQADCRVGCGSPPRSQPGLPFNQFFNQREEHFLAVFFFFCLGHALPLLNEHLLWRAPGCLTAQQRPQGKVECDAHPQMLAPVAMLPLPLQPFRDLPLAPS